MELVGDVDAVQVGLVGLGKVDDVTLGLGKANPNVESVNLHIENGLRIYSPRKYFKSSSALSFTRFEDAIALRKLQAGKVVPSPKFNECRRW